MRDLTNQEFVSFFYTELAERHIYPADRRSLDSQLVLANKKRTCEDGHYVGPWELQIICPAPQERWHQDALLCQFGSCCGHQTVSVSTTSLCPLCGEFVSGG